MVNQFLDVDLREIRINPEYKVKFVERRTDAGMIKGKLVVSSYGAQPDRVDIYKLILKHFGDYEFCLINRKEIGDYETEFTYLAYLEMGV